MPESNTNLELFADIPAPDRFDRAKAAAREWAASLDPARRLQQARSFGVAMMKAFWTRRTLDQDCSWSIAAPFDTWPQLADRQAAALARELGETAAGYDDNEAGFRLGSVYTSTMPDVMRSQWGAFYTPVPFVEVLLDRVGQAGFDWSRGSIADPACGGGAFLTPVAQRMNAHSGERDVSRVLSDICARLRGFELDPFSAWVSHVCLEAALLPLCLRAQRRLPRLVEVADTLTLNVVQRFDLVVGNPPYGKVRLSADARQRYARSLYGHANLYGLFADQALRMAARDGIVALVTPTSFLGGQYFKSLRSLLAESAPLRSIDFVEQRTGVFEDVLQETSLAVFVKGASLSRTHVRVASLDERGHMQSALLGHHTVDRGNGPWLLPRRSSERALIGRALSMRTRLRGYGFGVSTGPLVWNRHKPQLRRERSGKEHPLIWAESVGPGGFRFDPRRKHHAPYIEVQRDQEHLLTARGCMLVQRTTAKEQRRRLVAALMPDAFVRRFGGVVVENHLNVISPERDAELGLDVLCVLLNSEAVDQAFRCISGSVAVSAYELNELPLPDPNELGVIAQMVRIGAPPALIERRIGALYGLQ